MSRRGAATKLAICKWLRDQIKLWEAEARAELEVHMIPDDRETATVGDIKVGTVTYCNGRRTFSVTDEQGYTQWVAERWPDEIVVTQHVNAAFETKLKDRAMRHGALIDDDGEVCPHVDIDRDRPYFMAKTNEEAGIVLSGMLSNRMIDTMRELEG